IIVSPLKRHFGLLHPARDYLGLFMFDSLRGLWLGRLRIPIRRVRELIHVRRGATLAGTAAQARRPLPPEVKTPVEEHPSEAELGPRGSHTAPNGGSYPATAGREAIRAGVLRRSASAPVRLSRDGRGARPFLALQSWLTASSIAAESTRASRCGLCQRVIPARLARSAWRRVPVRHTPKQAIWLVPIAQRRHGVLSVSSVP